MEKAEVMLKLNKAEAEFLVIQNEYKKAKWYFEQGITSQSKFDKMCELMLNADIALRDAKLVAERSGYSRGILNA